MSPVIIALDFANAQTTLTFLDQFIQEPNLFVKVGMELFYFEGPRIIQELQRRKIKIFLDLKLYDIPHTVEQAMYQLGRQGVEMVTVHAQGGQAMIQSAKRGLQRGNQEVRQAPTKLLAVTQLTSTSQAQMQTEQQIAVSLPASVTHLAKLAQKSGADGVIASAWEDPAIHVATSADFWCVNPGIRLSNEVIDDQKRVATPKKARQLGSQAIVVGRSITQADAPVAAYHQILQEWEAVK
ncbi:orotidine-5'-phosphate decarboxylase [Bombilactobacillus folatiphilus]|uniref:Orotidine 5'-phosphate decarboxylase n=1 Tax=Bombilactobacillus folatiphilus TaxID=2923362 RepID=A0ABY4P8D9_9LACO|nr:orotidine-5'-phosphate decarboxylase [Bombilactobacillus folatiphilus]UQS81789.1 orotidine-5'-phosphate decarboxylase [Bombilactobacillus folatiphilus]